MSARTEWFYHVSHPLLIPVWTEDHFINLKFNRSLFYDVGRECSLEGKFEAVINRTPPAYLLKLDGKDKTVFSHQVRIMVADKSPLLMISVLIKETIRVCVRPVRKSVSP